MVFFFFFGNQFLDLINFFPFRKKDNQLPFHLETAPPPGSYSRNSLIKNPSKDPRAKPSPPQ